MFPVSGTAYNISIDVQSTGVSSLVGAVFCQIQQRLIKVGVMLNVAAWGYGYKERESCKVPKLHKTS
jgi:hypothetical protein